MRAYFASQLLLVSMLSMLDGSSSALAQSGASGPNSDFPDSNLVMPFDVSSNRETFFAVSNVGADSVRNTWVAYDEIGSVVAQVVRDIAGQGGTDIVDPKMFQDRRIDPQSGDVSLGPSQNLSGRRGFVVVIGDDEDRLIGNFTIANTQTSSAYGTSAMGLGAIGTAVQGAFLFGTTFSPATLQDDQLIVIALNVPDITSLSNGAQVDAGTELLNLNVTLYSSRAANGVLASGDFRVAGTALFASFDELFPGTSLNSSATIVVEGSEGADYSGSSVDPDNDDAVALIGFAGQAVGPYGAAQNLRNQAGIQQ